MVKQLEKATRLQRPQQLSRGCRALTPARRRAERDSLLSDSETEWTDKGTRHSACSTRSLVSSMLRVATRRSFTVRRAASRRDVHTALTSRSARGPWGPAESPPCPAVRALYGRGDKRVREAVALPHGPGAQSWPGARALKLLGPARLTPRRRDASEVV